MRWCRGGVDNTDVLYVQCILVRWCRGWCRYTACSKMVQKALGMGMESLVCSFSERGSRVDVERVVCRVDTERVVWCAALM